MDNPTNRKLFGKGNWWCSFGNWYCD
jgi:hypothetical protein